MERRAAMTAAFSGAAILATATVTLAAVGGVHMLGFGAGATRHAAVAPNGTDLVILDRVVVVSTPTTVAEALPPEAPAAPVAPPAPTAPGRGSAAPAASATPPATPTATTAAPPTPTSGTTAPAAPSTAAPAPTAAPTVAPASTARPTTTTAAPTGTTLPPGARIPSDWPPDRPIPPIPANCKKPVLEDNGVWNCEH